MEDFSFLIQLIRTYGYWVVGVSIFLECMGVPFPGETGLILGGVAASLGHLDLTLVIVVAAFAAVLGDNVGYFIGKKFGRRIIKRLEKFPIFKAEHIEKAEKFYKDHGSKTVFLGRFTAILRTYSALFAGIFDMHYTTFFLYNLSGGVLWSIIFGFVGFIIGNNLPLLGKIITDFNLFFWVIVGAIVVWLVAKHFLVKRQKKRDESLHQAHKASENTMQTEHHHVTHPKKQPDQD